MEKEFYIYTAKFNPEPEGGYTVIFPALRGIVTYGKSFEEAQDFAKDALVLHLESLIARKKPLPKDKKERKSQNVAFIAFHVKLIAGKVIVNWPYESTTCCNSERSR